MKELTIEEKAKAYDEALEKARLVLQERGNEPDGASILSELFPELAGSEGERIRKWLIEMVEEVRKVNPTNAEHNGNCSEAVAWLEKQGEHAKFRDSIQVGDKVTRNQDGVLVNLSQLKRVAKPSDDIDTEKQGEQKPILDVEIPFGAKDSELEEVSYNIPNGYHAEIEDNKVVIKKGGQKPTNKVEPKFKIGDTITDERGVWSNKKIEAIENENYVVRCLYTNNKQYIPINTQDEYIIVEQKPAWSEEDEKILNTVIHNLRYPGVNYYKKPIEEKVKWLKDLKEKVQPQPKQEWSEEDDRHRIHTISLVEDLREWANKDGMHSLCLERCAESIDWLKSLRSQNRWKPSEEQMLAINTAINVLGKGTLNGKQLIELQEQLKKLYGGVRYENRYF